MRGTSAVRSMFTIKLIIGETSDAQGAWYVYICNATVTPSVWSGEDKYLSVLRDKDSKEPAASR